MKHFCSSSSSSSSSSSFDSFSNLPNVVTRFYLGSLNSEQGIQRLSEKIIIHPGWDPSSSQNDYAIVKLEASATVNGIGESTGLTTVAMNRDSMNPQDVTDLLRVIGFGRTDNSSPAGSQILLEATLRFVPDAECASVWDDLIGSGSIDPDTMLCAMVDEGGIGPCNGKTAKRHRSTTEKKRDQKQRKHATNFAPTFSSPPLSCSQATQAAHCWTLTVLKWALYLGALALARLLAYPLSSRRSILALVGSTSKFVQSLALLQDFLVKAMAPMIAKTYTQESSRRILGQLLSTSERIATLRTLCGCFNSISWDRGCSLVEPPWGAILNLLSLVMILICKKKPTTGFE